MEGGRAAPDKARRAVCSSTMGSWPARSAQSLCKAVCAQGRAGIPLQGNRGTYPTLNPPQGLGCNPWCLGGQQQPCRSGRKGCYTIRCSLSPLKSVYIFSLSLVGLFFFLNTGSGETGVHAASQHSIGFATVPLYLWFVLSLCELPTLAHLHWLRLMSIFRKIRVAMLVCLAQHLFSDH